MIANHDSLTKATVGTRSRKHRERDAARAVRRGVAMMVLVPMTLYGHASFASAEPLPSWNDGPAKRAIVKFVGDATRAGAPTFVQPGARVAVFDNDGTLWAEQPVYVQLRFAIDRVRQLAPEHPEWKEVQPFKAVLEGDLRGLSATGEKGAVDLIAATHAGMTPDQFREMVVNWLATARHPRFERPYTTLVYQPMLELLDHLRTNGVKTFIVSGGGAEFMRAFAQQTYGIPPEQVVGSTAATRFEIGRDGQPVLIRQAKIDFVVDGPGKPVAINRFIGRRPILAFGNSDGDRQMLEWTAAGNGTRFVGLVHHTDGEREWAYGRSSHVGRLDKGLDEAIANGWIIVDMKRDWRVVFPPSSGGVTR